MASSAAAAGLTGPTSPGLALARTSLEPGGVGLVPHGPRAQRPDEVELKVTLCGLSGADVVIYHADPAFDWVRSGTVLGHEAVGVVSVVGLLVPEWPAPGTRVVPVSMLSCGNCEECLADRPQQCARPSTLGLNRDGTAAPTALVPWQNLLAVPDGLLDTTAVLAEPTSVAWRAAATVGQIRPGDRVAVSTTRAVGLLAALIARSLGADVVMVGRPGPHHEQRRELAAGLGLDSTTAPEPESVDVWIEASGSGKQLATAVEVLRPGGKLVLVAMYATGARQTVNTVVGKELTVLTSYASTRSDFEDALEFLTTMPDLGERLITVYPMEQAVEALRLTAEGTTADGGRPLVKAVLRPNG
ncbi:MAG TPA: alcohol dehydrogenase catalytic domain-containing protein [Arthrobacter sp.]|nr:alcohol dehydrogenase catalytic domain-containing protein [Arthrobacter sp.]